MTRPTLGVLMIARDEAHQLATCLDGLTWCDQIVVTVDTRSTDETAAIARRFTDRVVAHPFESMVQQRLVTLAHLTTDWVWVMDADERMTAPLRAAIEAALTSDDPAVAGYWVPRRNLMLGVWVRHGGWYPDHQFRLWRRGRAHYDPAQPAHEQMLVDGARGTLDEPFIHYNYERIGQLFSKQAFYARQEARVAARLGRRARPQNFILQPLRAFWRRYVRLDGWRDGPIGLLLAGAMAWSEVVFYAQLARLAPMDWSAGPRRTPTIAA